MYRSTIYALAALPSVLAQYGDSGSKTTATAEAASSSTSTIDGVHVVKVGDGGLTFDPQEVTAAVGDVVEFHFYPMAHSVAQSAFASPCQPLNGTGNSTGFFSGPVRVSSGVSDTVFSVTVEDDSPAWYYCATGQHCQNGMVGVINAPTSGKNTIKAYAAAGALCSSSSCSFLQLKRSNPTRSLSSYPRCDAMRSYPFKCISNNTRPLCSDGGLFKTPLACNAARKKGVMSTTVATSGPQKTPEEGHDNTRRRALQFLLWTAEGLYILWLFLLPYAPGDPVWALSADTINAILGLSLNFFFILPLMNSVGIHLMEAPILHPTSEGLFNLVVGWTFMFAPLLFTDRKRDRYKGSLDVLWGFQMFLTNTFLIPYMAIRLNDIDTDAAPRKRSQLGSLMTNGASIVGLTGGFVCLLSVLWALFGRMDGDFGTLADRWEFLQRYIGSERLAYAFIWDIVLYIIFQPWLIGDNLQNVEQSKVELISKLRFIPVVGLVGYLLCLNPNEEM